MIINALDATPAGGKITIQTKMSDTKEEKGVKISITHTGKGIQPRYMAKMLNPFLPTKGMGSAAGLGLTLSAAIIQRHGGTIKVHSKPEEGTIYTIWLPQSPIDLKSDTHMVAREIGYEGFSC
jgi:signal transduction histidine kinase